MNNKELFKSHATKLDKIRFQLKNHQVPSGSTIILGDENRKTVETAVILLEETIKLINKIK
jgi:hypothetical protein